MGRGDRQVSILEMAFTGQQLLGLLVVFILRLLATLRGAQRRLHGAPSALMCLSESHNQGYKVRVKGSELPPYTSAKEVSDVLCLSH